MIERLLDKTSWDLFLKSKLDNNYLSSYAKKQFIDYISQEKYREICQKIVNGTYQFTIPKKHIISKNSSSKRRVVYTFNDDEMMIMKCFAFFLYDYDYLFSPNLYSFRKNNGVRNALMSISNNRKLKEMYGYKIDISNYFNSVDPFALITQMQDYVSHDVIELYKAVLLNDKTVFKNQIIHENKGAMTGTPLSSFAANIYIKKIDEFFFEEKVEYYRYADDIIFFTDSPNKRDYYVEKLLSLLKEKNLTVNKEKESYIEPHQYFEFLGFGFYEDKIDISKHAIKKFKGKVRRKIRKLYRWRIAKNFEPEKALVAANRVFNKKFYGKSKNETSWSYWYFPFINVSKSLKEIDHYIQQEERYLFTGHHTKKNYKLCPYETLKKYGYRSLVNEFYIFKNH